MTWILASEIPKSTPDSPQHLHGDPQPPNYGTMAATPPFSAPSDPAGSPRTPAKSSPRQRRLLAGLAVVCVLSGSLIAVMVPFFPSEAASRGVSQTTISGVFSCFALTQMLLYPLVAPLALRLGVTRLYNIGIATAGVSTIAFGTFYHIPGGAGFIAACFVARVVEAAGTAAVSACGFTIIGNQFSGRSSSVVALVSAAQSAGLSVAPAIGGGLYAAAGFGLPFYVLGSVMVVTAAVNMRFMPAVEKTDDSPSDVTKMFRTLAASPENWLCLLIVFCYSLDFFTFESCVAPYAVAALGITPATLGLYFTVATGSYVFTSILWARLAERTTNPYSMMSLCLLLVSASQLLIPPASFLGLQPTWWLFGLGMTLQEALFGGAYIPCFQLMLAASVRAGLHDDLRTHAFVSSVFWSAYSLGTVVGPLAGGLLVDAYGFPLMMMAVAALTLTVALLTACQAGVRTFRAR
ncbi:MFS-type transporter SLC18B1-like [Amphibalanus amphitrite]|uniref:MFS-type transporter SLC18B1-like n=1 Tax=Amphibalanus amphitrite TaxID=1232801 RepID=UPI001C919A2D|nr:MFS-type transporter SLC18B1-like [Amphibalanus amphitrite]